jgi:hypothetical protein
MTAIATEFFEAMGRRDVDGAMALVTDDIAIQGPSTGD